MIRNQHRGPLKEGPEVPQYIFPGGSRPGVLSGLGRRVGVGLGTDLDGGSRGTSTTHSQNRVLPSRRTGPYPPSDHTVSPTPRGKTLTPNFRGSQGLSRSPPSLVVQRTRARQGSGRRRRHRVT